MRKTDDQKQAAYQQRIEMLRAKVRRIEKRKNEQDRRDRTHVGVIIGWAMIEYAEAHPKSDARRALVAAIKSYLGEHPDDRAMSELLARANAVSPAVMPVPATVQDEAAE